jgi:RNA recognition motif-containing protein
MGKKLYVGNLSFNVDSNQLTDAFAEFGTVDSANVITDRETGRSKGFAFV